MKPINAKTPRLVRQHNDAVEAADRARRLNDALVDSIAHEVGWAGREFTLQELVLRVRATRSWRLVFARWARDVTAWWRARG